MIAKAEQLAMGYRKAAVLRRTQYVSGQYRTNKNGTTYWVEGHVRNELPSMPFSLKGVAIAAIAIAGLTLSLVFMGEKGQPNETKIERMQRRFGKDCESTRSLQSRYPDDPSFQDPYFLKRYCTPYGM